MRQRRFQKLLNGDATDEVEVLLKARPALAQNPLAFWSEGVLMMPAKHGARKMIELLMKYGAWCRTCRSGAAWYYLWHYEVAAFLLERGMNANHMNHHHTTVLHDMAYKGDIRKATLLIERGANVNAIDEEFRSTPLGLAARWGHREMAALVHGARRESKSQRGTGWATPLAWAEKKGHAAVAGIFDALALRVNRVECHFECH